MAQNLRKRRERLAQAAQKKDSAPAAADSRRMRGKVSRKAKTQFTVQFATLLDSGLPIMRALRILEAQMSSGPMQQVVAALAEDVESGASLSEAVSKHPQVFDELYANMVRAGEAGGTLSEIFMRQAEYLEKRDALIRRIRGAAIYPVFVSVFAVGILVFIIAFVVPKFKSAFSQLGGSLPPMTQLLIDASDWLISHLYVIPLVPLLIWGGLVLIGRTPGGRRFLDRSKLRLWIFGPIALKGQIARFARTLGTLSQSGVPLLQALDIARDASGNSVVAEAIENVRDSVREGESLAQPLAESGIFDEIVVNMVDVGEETGELDRMLMRIAESHEAEVNTRISAAMSVMEPVLIVVMGAIVGFIVVALFLPLLKMQEMLTR